jgi:hypothetical protein
MPRWKRGPFTELQNLSELTDETTEEDLLERMDAINTCLATHHCNCNGHIRNRQRDPYFGGDLSELVSRCIPHSIDGPPDPVTGEHTSVTAHVRIETLTVEVDENDEVCCWIYEES